MRSTICRGLVCVLVPLLTVACGSDTAFVGATPGGEGGETPQVPAAPSAAASSISFTVPVTDRIEDLGAGNYRQLGSVSVTDRDGLPVVDGTELELILIDTVMTQGSTASVMAGGDTLIFTGNGQITRRCTHPFGDNEAEACAQGINDFASTVTRGDSIRQIREGDYVVLAGGIEPEDRFRRVAVVNGATSLTVDAPYSRNYANVRFWVGTAESGAAVAGIVEDQAPTPGRAFTRGGIARILVNYPANVSTLGYGCFGYDNNGRYGDGDKRDGVPQSRQVLLAAIAGNGRSGTTISSSLPNAYCFSAIRGGVIQASQESISLGAEGDTAFVGLTPIDGGDGIRRAYTFLGCSIENLNRSGQGSTFALDVTVLPNSDGAPATDQRGFATVAITRIGAFGGGSATVTCRSNDPDETPASIDVTALDLGAPPPPAPIVP